MKWRPPVPIQKPEDGNLLWPLPKDYYELTVEGQRQARTNAVKLWALRGKDFDPENLVGSLRFFDMYYLEDPEALFYPMDGHHATPEFHNEISRNFMDPRWRYTAVAAPRGHAKSSYMKKLVMTGLLSVPRFPIIYMTSTNGRVKELGADLIWQFRNNPRIIEDFAPEYEGRILPPRGAAPQGMQGMLRLANGATLYTTSVESKNRGGRSMWGLVDDPEADAAESTDMARVRADFETFLFRIFLPMIQHPGARGMWFGTMLSRKHLLWQIMSKNPDGSAVDSRFNYWNRLLYKALYETPDGRTYSLWPERFSVPRLHEIEQEMGTPAFRAEFLNEPGAGAENGFWLSDDHAYTVENEDTLFATYPRKSQATITYTNHKGESVTKTMAEFLATAITFTTVDWAATVGPNSDYSAVATMALTPHNELFVMDLFEGKVLGSDLARHTFAQAHRWQSGLVGVEGASVGQLFTHLIVTRFQEAVSESGYAPRIQVLPHQNVPKVQRIESLRWRFGDAPGTTPGLATRRRPLIKFPLRLRHRHPWSRLFAQLDDFNPLLEDGGLQNDDILDAVAMSTRVVPGLPQMSPDAQPEPDVIQQLLKGEIKDKNGEPLIHHLNLLELPVQLIDAMIEAKNKRSPKSPVTQFGTLPNAISSGHMADQPIYYWPGNGPALHDPASVPPGRSVPRPSYNPAWDAARPSLS